MSKIWTYIETPLFTQQLKEFGDSPAIKQLIDGVLWAISKGPERFPTIPSTKLQFVRTIEFSWGDSLIPLKIWFTCIDEDQIEILSIGQDAIEDAYTDDDSWLGT